MNLTEAKKKLSAIRRHMLKALLLGALLGLIYSVWINYDFFEYYIDSFIVGWVSWTTVLTFVLPAILDDDF
jgi:hypothetical protein